MLMIRQWYFIPSISILLRRCILTSIPHIPPSQPRLIVNRIRRCGGEPFVSGTSTSITSTVSESALAPVPTPALAPAPSPAPVPPPAPSPALVSSPPPPAPVPATHTDPDADLMSSSMSAFAAFEQRQRQKRKQEAADEETARIAAQNTTSQTTTQTSIMNDATPTPPPEYRDYPDASSAGSVSPHVQSSSMSAFMELERRLAQKKVEKSELQSTKATPAAAPTPSPNVSSTSDIVKEKPIPPDPLECCGNACPNCIWIKYTEALDEYEDWARSHRQQPV